MFRNIRTILSQFPHPPHDPYTIISMLTKSIRDELKARSDYKAYSRRCRERGDLKSSEMFSHIGEEEQHHVEELLNRLGEVSNEDVRKGKYIWRR